MPSDPQWVAPAYRLVSRMCGAFVGLTDVTPLGAISGNLCHSNIVCMYVCITIMGGPQLAWRLLPRTQTRIGLVGLVLVWFSDAIFRKMTNRNQTDTNEMATTETKYQTDFYSAEKYQN